MCHLKLGFVCIGNSPSACYTYALALISIRSFFRLRKKFSLKLESSVQTDSCTGTAIMPVDNSAVVCGLAWGTEQTLGGLDVQPVFGFVPGCACP